MQRSCIRRAVGEQDTAVEGMLGRERELVAQLRELLLPPYPPPTPSGDGTSWSSGLVPELFDNFDECSLPGLRGACSHASAMAEAPVCAGRRRRRRSKRARDEEHEEQLLAQGGVANAKPRCGNNKTRRRNKEETTTIVTKVPDFNGFQWRKYGQKQIEGTKYPRSYYRCINSTEQGCPAKRTVQRNDDVNGDGAGGPPGYTVVYIAEHTCKTIESVAPVILETTVCATKPAAENNAAARALLLTPDGVVGPAADSSSTGSSTAATTTGSTESPALSSDVTWSSSDANSSDHDYYPHVDRLFAVDDWDPATPAAAAFLLQEMDFNGPIRSPVHVAADGWIDDLLVNEPINIPTDCHLMFGF